ncbi:hypothetical protein [Streptomyces sp. NPDC048663]|uniref:hypothetical protein n=1 Tax=Streptomyces sp. NPDC048663 TaxID=3155638 RepID=UPI0034386ED6
MGSLRNPVGPLPSSIYWRRRVVMVSVVAVLALLITWIVTSGGGGGKKGADGADGKNPASTITPGPSGSGPAISQAPGGRDESSGGGGGSSGTGAGSSAGSGSTSGSGGGSSDGSGGGGSSGSGGSSGASSGSGDVTSGSGGTAASLPGSSTLPNCTASAVSLTLKSLHNSYSPEQTPTFELTAKNRSSSDCKIDLGPKKAVLTITPASADDSFWSSADCPRATSSRWYRVPAGSGIVYTLKWDRKPSAPQCATPAAGSAGSGTYLLEAAAPGYPKSQASFVLTAD